MKYLLQMQEHQHTSKIAIKHTFYQNTKQTSSAWLHDHRFPKNDGESESRNFLLNQLFIFALGHLIWADTRMQTW
jgi:hypothetical protein